MKKLMIMAALVTVMASPAALANVGDKKEGMWFSKVDANSDGVITREEHERASADKFAKMDANKDGRVTLEEARAAKEQKKERKTQ